jgi:hypothetical protein
LWRTAALAQERGTMALVMSNLDKGLPVQPVRMSDFPEPIVVEQRYEITRVDDYRRFWLNTADCKRLPDRGHTMKRLLLAMLVLLFLSGCSVNSLWKWIDEMEWEREDQTIRVTDFFLR